MLIANNSKLALAKFFITVTIFSLLITPTRAFAEGQIEEIDYDKIGQKALNINKNTVYFDVPKNIKQITNYIKKFPTRLSNNIIAYGLIDMDNSLLEIPVNIDVTTGDKNISDSFEKTRKEFLNIVELSKNDPEITKNNQLGENTVNFDELNKEYSPEFIKSKSAKNQGSFKISKIYFESSGEIPEIKKVAGKKADSNLNKDVLKKVKPNLTDNSSTDVTENNLSEVRIQTLTNDEKQQVLKQVEENKIAQKMQKEEQRLAPEAIKYKDKLVEEGKVKRKELKKQLSQKVKDGKKSEISVDDVYTLGEEAEDFGIKIKPSQKIGDPITVITDENRVKNYKEPKEDKKLGIIETILSFGSVKTEAFSPEHYNERINHATTNSHRGTAWDLTWADTTNGTRIQMYAINGTWAQSFSSYYDGTIRVGGKCVDLDWNNAFNGAKIHLWDCNGTSAQKWQFDTAGRMRLARDPSYCIDSSYGGPGTPIYLFQCTTATERFRSGDVSMRIYARRGNPTTFDIGHAFVSLERFDDRNNISAFTTYSLWPNEDFDDQNTNTQFKEANDKKRRGHGDAIFVNKIEDLTNGYNATQNGIYSPAISFWRKNITNDQYWDMVGSGYTNSYWYYNYVFDVCTGYSKNLWIKYLGYYFFSTNLPADIYYILINDWVYA